MVVLVNEGIGDEVCDDNDAADDVGDDDDDDDALGLKTFASALRGRVPMGVIGAVGAEGGAGPSGPLSPVLCLVLQLVTPKSSGTKGRRGAIPWRDRPSHKFLLFSLHTLLLLVALGAKATCLLSLFTELLTRILNLPRGMRKCKRFTFLEK